LTGLDALTLPAAMRSLIDRGWWPSTDAEVNSQNLRPLVDPARLRQAFPQEHTLFLYAPPFRTVRELLARDDHFWLWPEAALSQIDAARTLVIGDFGLGSDAPLALDYRDGGAEPSVIRLQWGAQGVGNHWVTATKDFAEFCSLLGIPGG